MTHREIDLSNALLNKNMALCILAQQRKIVMLQGPVGPAFAKLAEWLHSRGVSVTKVCLSAGDEWDYQERSVRPVLRYTDRVEVWPGYIKALMVDEKASGLLLFGQAREYHRQAIRAAHALGLSVFVMEEGYFRPGYVTLELNGVNGESTAMNDLLTFHANSLPSIAPPPQGHCTGHFWKMAFHASCHYIAMHIGRHKYPHYRHHRRTNLMHYCRLWLRSFLRRILRAHLDHKAVSKLRSSDAPFYFVPLQSPEDSQVNLYSEFPSIESFIDRVIASFAQHAPASSRLLFKQHPMSRGGLLYLGHIRQAARKYRIESRVVFITEGNNEAILKNCRAVVLINSTLGLQALTLKVPVKALGRSIYDRSGLTDQQCLDSFWNDPQRPHQASEQWLNLLKCRTQISGSIYALASERWPALTARLY